MIQRIDWSPRKQFKTVLLSEQSYIYEEIRRQLNENVTKDGIQKFLKQYKEICYKTTLLKAGKDVQQQGIIEELKDYAQVTEENHLDVYKME